MVAAPPFEPAPGSPAENACFKQIQSRLRDHFLRFSDDPRLPYTTVVVPSQSFDPTELAKIAGVAHYEERSLFNLMLLRHPRLRVVYVTSKRLNPLIVDYYLHQLRSVPGAHARQRLILLDCDDASSRPLTEKILERPRLLRRIAAAIRDTNMAHLVTVNSTPLERTLAVQLGIPLNNCDPDLNHLGTKTGSRRVFAEAGVPMAPGHIGLRDVRDLVDATVDLWAELPAARRFVVKLDDSFSGEGNAILDLRPVADRAPTIGSRADAVVAIRGALPHLRFEAEGLDWEGYRAQFDAMGGVCELWVEGEGKTSPSAQLRINPLGEAQAISTHDQVLGGPSGQVYTGATFPADARYRVAIQALGLRVGDVLAAQGALGRFAVDFLAVPKPGGGVELYAVEINLRQGGTTHPFNTLKFITDGHYDVETGEFQTRQGRARCYFATDSLKSSDYRGILPFDLMDRLVVDGIHFRSDETGVVFHLLGCLSEYGKLGCTAVASDIESARALYARAVQVLDDLGRG